MYLIATNIFLEILLKQKRKEKCKKFLNANLGQLHISDFSLHSIGLDFDDAYQYGIAKSYGLKPVTMDDDFKRITDIEVIFL